jgi:hypothetical protein
MAKHACVYHSSFEFKSESLWYKLADGSPIDERGSRSCVSAQLGRDVGDSCQLKQADLLSGLGKIMSLRTDVHTSKLLRPTECPRSISSCHVRDIPFMRYLVRWTSSSIGMTTSRFHIWHYNQVSDISCSYLQASFFLQNSAKIRLAKLSKPNYSTSYRRTINGSGSINTSRTINGSGSGLCV